ncbi:MAG: pilus assembly protein N-terminal domain-containing protein [Planctomycetota bacterium]|nr:pilus assembly protein N-terminal domain-containing protein [Planctomycetota bacterium]
MQSNATIPQLRFRWASHAVRTLGILVGLLGLARPLSAEPVETSPLTFHIGKPAERLDMMVNTSRVLSLENKVPRLFVSDPSVIQATPLSPHQIQVSALKPGLTQLNLWDEKGSLFSVDVIVLRNAAELIDLLRTEFPEATLHVRPLNDETVYIKGFVPRASMLDEIILLAKGYYRNVINGVAVGGVQQVALHVKVMEVSRSKLKQLGIDWAVLASNFSLTESAAGVIGTETVQLNILGSGTKVTAFVQALRQYDLVKLLAEPTVVTMSGRAASFNSGGEIPVPVPNGLGTMGIEWKQYGTKIEFVPVVLGNGTIRLEVRPSVSEVDEARGTDISGVRVPALTERHVDTAVEMRAGQTLALAGLIQNRVESQNRGIPFLADLPWVGRAFSRVTERVNEVELLIMVTPELIGPLDPHQVPQCGPGQTTSPPSDCEFYSYGYLEVPNCCPDGQCSNCQKGTGLPSTAQALPSGPAAVGGQPVAPDPSQSVSPLRSRSLPVQTDANAASGYRPNTLGPARPASVPASPAGATFGPLGYDPLR